MLWLYSFIVTLALSCCVFTLTAFLRNAFPFWYACSPIMKIYIAFVVQFLWKKYFFGNVLESRAKAKSALSVSEFETLPRPGKSIFFVYCRYRRIVTRVYRSTYLYRTQQNEHLDIIHMEHISTFLLTIYSRVLYQVSVCHISLYTHR